MKTQEKKELETVQNETAKLIKKILDAKVPNLTKQDLVDFSLQELVLISDDLPRVKKTDGGKVASNLALDLVTYFLDTEITELPLKDTLNRIKGMNLGNYFNLPDDYDSFKPITKINLDIITKRITTNKKNSDDQATRQTTWLKRAKAYLNSHIVGDGDDSLKVSDKSEYYFELKGSTVLLHKKLSE